MDSGRPLEAVPAEGLGGGGRGAAGARAEKAAGALALVGPEGTTSGPPPLAQTYSEDPQLMEILPAAFSARLLASRSLPDQSSPGDSEQGTGGQLSAPGIRLAWETSSIRYIQISSWTLIKTQIKSVLFLFSQSHPRLPYPGQNCLKTHHCALQSAS